MTRTRWGHHMRDWKNEQIMYEEQCLCLFPAFRIVFPFFRLMQKYPIYSLSQSKWNRIQCENVGRNRTKGNENQMRFSFILKIKMRTNFQSIWRHLFCCRWISLVRCVRLIFYWQKISCPNRESMHISQVHRKLQLQWKIDKSSFAHGDFGSRNRPLTAVVAVVTVRKARKNGNNNNNDTCGKLKMTSVAHHSFLWHSFQHSISRASYASSLAAKFSNKRTECFERRNFHAKFNLQISRCRRKYYPMYGNVFGHHNSFFARVFCQLKSLSDSEWGAT